MSGTHTFKNRNNLKADFVWVLFKKHIQDVVWVLFGFCLGTVRKYVQICPRIIIGRSEQSWSKEAKVKQSSTPNASDLQPKYARARVHWLASQLT